MYSLTNRITEKSGSSITVSNSEVNLFRGIVFHNVILSDSLGIPIIKASRIETGVKFMSLFRRKIEIDALRIIEADIMLTRLTPDAPLNIEPFLKSSKSNKESVLPPWHVNFKSILLRNCRVTYDVLSKATSDSSGFDPWHIVVNDLSSVIRLKIEPNNNYSFEIEKLSASNGCGLQIDQMSLVGQLKSKSLKINDIYLKSRNSIVRIPSIEATFNNFKDFGNADSVTLSPSLLKATIFPADFSCLYPNFSTFTKSIDISLSVSGKINDLSSKLRLNMENLILLDGRVTFKGLTDYKNFTLNGQVDMLRVHPEGLEYLSKIISKRSVTIPALHSLGTISYMGNISTIDRSVILKGDFLTAAGNMETNISLSHSDSASLVYKGTLQTNTFDLSRLFSEKSTLGNVAFNLSVEGKQLSGSKYEGAVKGLISQLNFSGYDYKDLTLNGRFNNDGFEGKALLNDENARLDFSGLVNMSDKYPVFRFDLIAGNVDLHALKLVKSTGSSKLSFTMHSDFMGRNLDDVTGILTAEDISFINNGYILHINKLQAEVTDEINAKSISIKSDILSGGAYGQFSFGDIKEEMKSLISRYLPSVIGTPTLPGNVSLNNFDFHFTLEPNDALTKVLELPFTLYETIKLDGFYRGNTGKFKIKALIPDMLYGKADIRYINLLFENPQNEAKFIAYAQAGNKGKYLDIDTDIRTMNDQSLFRFFWSNSGTDTHTGTISSNFRFSRDDAGKQVISANLLPTELILNDTVWQIHPARFNIERKRLKVEQFQITHRDEFIKMDGYASANDDDTLNVSFNSFRLDDVFQLLPKSTLLFGGKITGTASCPHLFRNGTMNASLFIDKFSINNYPIGDLTAISYWNNANKALMLNADVYEKSDSSIRGRHIATASGSYFPIGDSINLVVDGNKVPLSFLRVYINTILSEFEGLGSGRVRISGPIKNIGIYTRAYVENASFGIDMLNTRYYFSDSVFLTPRVAGFRNVKIRDKEGNIAYANGLIRHDHLKNSEVSINVSANNLLAMDIPVTADAYFSGIAYGTGTVSINGPQNDIVIDVNMRSEEKTRVVISFLDDSEVDEFNYINFIQPRSVRDESLEIDQKKKRAGPQEQFSPSKLTVNLQIEATPNAEIVLITDPSTGDEIKARGSGAVRAVISDAGDIELFGRYTIDNGSYKFIYENLLRRDFNIVRGGTIDFAGDPFTAQLDITANYSVDAQLTDLLTIDELSSLNLNRSNIPVNCVLNLNGELQRPGIELGLAFPSADEDLRRRIMNVINTDEMVNQQIVFLLLFGRFSSPTNNYSTGQSGVSSVLNTTISTLASQFNNMLNNVLGNSNLSFDFDYQNAAYELGTPGEWKVGMSGQWLDSRLTVEGNVGSRENLTQNGSSQFIGEFDANLRMKNSEKWSWKLFNRANDNRYFKSALNTQGFGVVYRENYNSLSELFKQMVETLKKPFIKKSPAQ